jgi:hypothetical protein
MHGTRDDLIRRIEVAFAEASPPGDDKLLHPQCMDAEDIKDFYGTASWRGIPDEIVARNNASLCFFSSEAYRFYLPAYLTWVLRHFNTSPSFAVDSTIYSLSPGEGSLREFAVSKYALLDSAQRRVVLDFLAYLDEYGSGEMDAVAVRKAIEYWSALE